MRNAIQSCLLSAGQGGWREHNDEGPAPREAFECRFLDGGYRYKRAVQTCRMSRSHAIFVRLDIFCARARRLGCARGLHAHSDSPRELMLSIGAAADERAGPVSVDAGPDRNLRHC